MNATRGDLEGRLFRTSWQDGTLDLLLGLAALGVAAAWALDAIALGGAVPGLLVAIWWPARRAVVEPRAGFVAFSTARTARSRRSAWIGIVVGAGFLTTTVLLLAGLRAGLPARWSAALPAVLCAIPVLLLGLALGLRRLVAYAAVFAAAGAGVSARGLEPEVAIAAGGVLPVAAGTVLLVRFLRAAAAVGAAS